MLRIIVKSFLLPPLALVVLFGLAAALARRRPRAARLLVVAGALLLLALSLPCVADLLLGSVQRHAPVDEQRLAALEPGRAVLVVLSAGVDREGGEFGGPTVDALTLQRLRYAAVLARRSGLPILTSGGEVAGGTPPVGRLMAEVLEREFGTAAVRAEDRSRTTRENARCCAEILRGEGVTHVVLVTHAWHMPRAEREFADQGFVVIAAPTGFVQRPRLEPLAFVPSAAALLKSAWFCHEQLGMLEQDLLGIRR